MLMTTLEREMARRTASSSRMLRHRQATGRSTTQVSGRAGQRLASQADPVAAAAAGRAASSATSKAN